MASDPGRWRQIVLLLGVLVFVGASTLAIRFDIAKGNYRPLPLHLDEYLHWGYAEAAVSQGKVALTDPFSGGTATTFSLAADLHERGFQAFLGAFQEATGIPYTAIFEFGPALVAAFLALCVFVLAETWGAGLVSAALVAAIPTTTRFLGPGLFVPIAIALPFLVAGLVILVQGEGPRAAVAFAIVVAALWTIHVIAAITVSAATLLYLLAAPSGRRKTALLMTAAIALPFLVAWPYYASVLDTAKLPHTGLPANLDAFLRIGALPLAAAGMGAMALAASKDGGRRAIGVMLALLLLSGEAIILQSASSGSDASPVYDRAIMVVYLITIILAGAGAVAAARGATALLTRGRAHARRGTLTALLVLALSIVLIAPSETSQAKTPLPEIVTQTQFASYEEAAQKLPAHYDLAIVDGAASMPWTAATQRPSVFVVYPTSFGQAEEATTFFAHGATDTRFLIERGVKIVVTPRAVNNPDLVAISSGVYALRPEIAARIR